MKPALPVSDIFITLHLIITKFNRKETRFYRTSSKVNALFVFFFSVNNNLCFLWENYRRKTTEIFATEHKKWFKRDNAAAHSLFRKKCPHFVAFLRQHLCLLKSIVFSKTVLIKCKTLYMKKFGIQ